MSRAFDLLVEEAEKHLAKGRTLREMANEAPTEGEANALRIAALAELHAGQVVVDLAQKIKRMRKT